MKYRAHIVVQDRRTGSPAFQLSVRSAQKTKNGKVRRAVFALTKYAPLQELSDLPLRGALGTTAQPLALGADKAVDESAGFHVLLALRTHAPQRIPGISTGNPQQRTIPENTAGQNTRQRHVPQNLSRSQLQKLGFLTVKMEKRTRAGPGSDGPDTGINGGGGRIPVHIAVRLGELGRIGGLRLVLRHGMGRTRCKLIQNGKQQPPARLGQRVMQRAARLPGQRASSACTISIMETPVCAPSSQFSISAR